MTSGFYLGLIGPTLQLIFEVLQLLWRQSKEKGPRACACAHRGYIGRIILVHHAVRIFHVGRHSGILIGGSSKGRQAVVKVISLVEECGCTNTFVSWWFASRDRRGMRLTDRTGEARVKATSRLYIRSWTVTLQQGSVDLTKKSAEYHGH